ncbi:solute carrier family 25 member 35-like isoform X2 [Bacillus rossius redtenbacheri]|uniref:solute carrier family 25 member 35-like isoform X2 n=1 Tax=Bacillus rossius redtenbacheri TaxID=93214 RepID=UPI002FDEEC62
MEFVTGGAASLGATVFTNPLEVVKTRLQLQGELRARGMYAVHYRGFFHAFYAVAKADGLLALQKGLVPGLWFQLALNGTRLGMYQVADNKGLTRNEAGRVSVPKSALTGAVAGCFGAFVGSPFYLVKTHLQARAAGAVAVGFQHRHANMVQGLREIYGQHSVLGLWRGAVAAMYRVSVGSTVQLAVLSFSKQWLEGYTVFREYVLLKTSAASLASGTSMTVFMTPFDVVSTRMYNQGVDAEGRGLLYKSVGDCFVKIWRSEGLHGLYKGFVPSCARVVPHSVLSLVFWDALKDLEKSVRRSYGGQKMSHSRGQACRKVATGVDDSSNAKTRHKHLDRMDVLPYILCSDQVPELLRFSRQGDPAMVVHCLPQLKGEETTLGMS